MALAGDRAASQAPGGGRLLAEVVEAARAGDLARAKPLAISALEAGLEHPLLLNLRALAFEEEGRFEESLADLRRAHLMAPSDFTILNACGLALARLDRPEEALACYDRALALRPDFGQAWFNRGWVLERLGKPVEASQAYARAAEIHPGNAQAWANLAHLDARRGDGAAARAHAARALEAQPGHPTAVLALAEVELTDPPAAEERLRALMAAGPLGPFDHAMAFSLLGDALDAEDRPAEAFAAYAEGNALFRREAASRFAAPGVPTVSETLTDLSDWAANLDPAAWRPTGNAAGASPAAGHVFLLGFPRSGTTLIESVLACHPDVVSLEERNTLAGSVLAFLGDPKDTARLAGLSGADLEPWRADYWARVCACGADPAGKVFIDKNPFNTMKLPLILKLFPRARLLFAVRDPRDVVLSCFRRRFTLNPSTYEFLSLEGAAQVYDLTMRLAGACGSLQPTDEYTLVYERLIADFKGEAKAVCAFIGADWRPELLDFAGRGRRGSVASASSAQIARGLYADGAGHWRRYKAELEPVLGILAPWVERFGYPAD